ncbi:MAG: TatD family hydrolase [Bacteroidales bacterium]|jgi:TatD DNase family protein|nr:TatD family hydrolase [Bacteroidales bacterium]
MIEFIDTHLHLYDEAFEPDFKDVFEKNLESGMRKAVFPSIDSSYYERQTSVANWCNGHVAENNINGGGKVVFEAMGLHPTSVGENWRGELDFVKEKLEGEKYVAVGEIGLDAHWSRDFVKEQKEVFYDQLQLASEYGLPVIIHERDATGMMFDVFDSLGGKKIKGVLHAFSGSLETFERAMKYGDLMVGIGGVLTYKNAGIAETLKHIPMERIVLETDSPYLSPVPFRGKRNDSSNIPLIAGRIAEIKNMDIEEVARITTVNATNLFSI